VFAISCSGQIGSGAWTYRVEFPKLSVKEPLLAGSNLFMVDERRIFVRVVWWPIASSNVRVEPMLKSP
jgi:hypothetical protein